MKNVLVTGTSFPHQLPVYPAVRRAASAVGTALAQGGFGLVTGNTPGVDSVAAAAFCGELRRSGGSPAERYTQLWLPHFSRGFWLPAPAYRPPDPCMVKLEDFEDWIGEAISRAAAAVMIAGRGGALRIAQRFLDAGKPVLPVPFTGGEAMRVFQEILRTRGDAELPGLTRSQFLQLALPWASDTGLVTNLLLGALADVPDIFISYRRGDSAMAAGRLHADLAERFGKQRVFMDLQNIAPGDTWSESIRRAIASCKVGIVLIGPRWLAGPGGRSRLQDEDDVLRRELTELIEGRKVVMPVLVDGAALPDAAALPGPLDALLRSQASTLDNSNWDVVVAGMAGRIEKVFAGASRQADASQAGRADGSAAERARAPGR